MPQPQANSAIYSSPKNQKVWFSKRDKKLESKYEEIAPNIPHVNVSYRDFFLKRCREYYEELNEEIGNIREIERWDEYEIVRMFGKGLNPTSLKTALNNINYFVKKINAENDVVRVVEYGPGSGWSTLMLYNQLSKKFPNRKIELYSVDISPHSVVATQNSLDYYQIPWRTVIEKRDVSTLKNCEGRDITLILEDFVEFTKRQPDDFFDGFFSSHGTAYLSESGYEELLSSVAKKGKKGAIFVADSLDPLFTVRLDVFHLLFCSLFPSLVEGMEEYGYGNSLVSNSKYFPGQEVKKLTKVNNPESLLFYNWNHFLLSKFKISYMIQMFKSIRITTDVIEEYREDVYPSYLVSSLVSRKNISGLSVLNDLPKCPLYITNCGILVTK